MALLLSSFIAVAQPAPAEVEASFAFAIGSSDLDEAMRARLDAIAAAMKRSPAWVLIIEGHTDASGAEALNQDVSQERAERTAAALARRGVDRARLVVRALGPSSPAASNATSEGRALNRRVVIRLQQARSEKPLAVALPPAPAEVAKQTPEKPAEPVVADAPVAEEKKVEAPRVEALAPAASVERTPVLTVAQPEKPGRARFWLAVGASAIAVASAATSTGYFVDSLSGAEALARSQVQLARTDLLPQSRTAWEGHSAAVGSAIGADQLAAGVFGGVAVAAAVTAVVLWLQESGAPAPAK